MWSLTVFPAWNLPTLRDDTDAFIAKAITKQQNAKALRQSAALLMGYDAADLRLGGGREGDDHTMFLFLSGQAKRLPQNLKITRYEFRVPIGLREPFPPDQRRPPTTAVHQPP